MLRDIERFPLCKSAHDNARDEGSALSPNLLSIHLLSPTPDVEGRVARLRCPTTSLKMDRDNRDELRRQPKASLRRVAGRRQSGGVCLPNG